MQACHSAITHGFGRNNTARLISASNEPPDDRMKVVSILSLFRVLFGIFPIITSPFIHLEHVNGLETWDSGALAARHYPRGVQL